MYHVMHIVSSPETGKKKRRKPYQRSVPRRTPPPPPLHPFLEIFSGRNCAVLKQIYFNTRHKHLNKQEEKKKLEHFYILLSRSKKKKTLGFSIVCQFCILTSSLQRSMYYFATRRRRRHVQMEIKMSVEVEIFFVINKRGLSSGQCVQEKCLS